MRSFLHIIFLTAITLSLGCERQEASIPPSGRVVKVGVIAPLSGPEKKSGDNALLGIQTAVQLQPYLQNGDRIELVLEDNKGTVEKTLSALKKLHEMKNVTGVLLMAKSDIVLSLSPVADTYEIPILALIATHPDITKDNQFISQLGFDDKFQGTVAALYIRDEMLVNRVAVFSDPDSVHYSFLADEFIHKYTSVGGEIIEHFTSFQEGEELQKSLEKLQGDKVQLLYLAVSTERVVELVRASNQINWHPEVMGSDGLLANIILQHREDQALFNGIMATDFYSSMLPKTEYGKKVIRIFKKLFSDPGTSYSALGCEGAAILLQALDRCDNTTNRSCANYMLRHTKEFEGLFGKIAIYENGKTERPIFVNVIDKQKMKFLVKVY